ncbi:MAG TPA: endo-1,4-beta-xylanase [Vicinamibacterales bacterium]|nr:endo-1,4-beta-xylanase [Vicinamibacterales bacterium]
MTRPSAYVAAAALAAATLAVPFHLRAQDAAPALKDLMPPGILVGAAINQRQSDGVDTAGVAIITKQFNATTPENLLKFQSVHPAADRFTFDAQDRYVAFGESHGMTVIGHNLVWHQQTPAWVFAGENGAPADRDTLLARMREHITTVVGRYRGRIHGWDVVNEALAEDGTLRDSPWHRGIGDDYVARAFEFAHAADPDAELYYNEYNLWKPEKRAGAIRLVQDLRRQGLRVDAIGVQGHWSLDTPTMDQIEAIITDLQAAGIKAMLTELDINLLPPTPNLQDLDAAARADAIAKTNLYANGLPDEVQQKLANRYADIFRMVLRHRDEIRRVTFWGVSDGDSWLNRGRMNYPLLWDRQHQPKPAFDAVVRVLEGR